MNKRLDNKLEEIYYRSDISSEEFIETIKEEFTSHGWKNIKEVTPDDVGLSLPKPIEDPVTGIITFPKAVKPNSEDRPLPRPPRQ